MAESRVNAVVILDAIPMGEFNTAVRLREELRDHQFGGDALGVRYARVQTVLDLSSVIAELEQAARETNFRPWLHLEAHGSPEETGFLTGDGSVCAWGQLKDLITPLNIATGLSLVLLLAACFGGSFTRAINATDRAPVLGLIGPTRELTAGQSVTDWLAFYRSFHETKALSEAVRSLTNRSRDGLYFGTTAEQHFYDVWSSYKRNACSEDQLELRALALRKQALSLGIPSTVGAEHFRNMIKSIAPSSFEKFRDHYFMYDLIPLNRTRFPVTYDRAELLAAQTG